MDKDSELYSADIKAREYVTNSEDVRENKNVLLSAAAGSGKTKTLVDRIVEKTKKLPENRHIDSFAVVTFTRAAAGELLEKIDKALSDEIAGLLATGAPADKNLAERLNHERFLLPGATIGTIDSFCLEVVRKNFTSVKRVTLDPSFKVDDDAAKLIRKETAAAVLEEYYGKDRDTGEFRIVRRLLDVNCSNRSDNDLVDMILKVCEFCDARPDPEGWLDSIHKNYVSSGDFEANEYWYGKILDAYVKELELARDHASGSLSTLVDPEYEKMRKENVKKWENDFRTIFSKITEEKERLSGDSFSSGLLFGAKKIKFDKAPIFSGFPKAESPEKTVATELKNRLAYERNLIKGLLNSAHDKLVEPLAVKENDLEANKELFEKGIAAVGSYVKVISDIVKKILEDTEKECAKRCVFSYAAIAHFALEILRESKSKDKDEGESDGTVESEDEDKDGTKVFKPSAVAVAYGKKFDEIIVDEYQDTSPIQEAILYLVSGIPSGTNNMVMVGDIKQSIYGFRNAKPDLMLEKSEQYDDPDDSGGTLKILSRNFRSRKEILAAVNEVFSKTMTKEAADIAYEKERHTLAYGAVETYGDGTLPSDPGGGKCELVFCRVPGEKKKPDKEPGEESESEKVPGEQNRAKYTAEACVVAGKIYGLIENGVQIYDKNKKKERPVGFGDICLIADKNKTLREIAAILKEIGLPVDAGSAELFFETSEIFDIIGFLQIIDNPRNDIPLAATLHSPFYGFSLNELAEIRLIAKIAGAKEKDDLWGQMMYIAAHCDSIVGYEKTVERIAQAIKDITGLRELSKRVNVSKFVWHLINFNGYYDDRDDIAKGNLRTVLDMSYPYDNGISGGLGGFLKNLDAKMKEDASKPDTMRMKGYSASSEAADKIRLMTVHGSKGLEFPVVFYIGTNFSKDDRMRQMYCDEELGIGLKVGYEPQEIDEFFMRIKRSGPHIVMKRRIDDDERKEMQRKVYVALTRAREKLYVIGNAADDELLRFVKPGPAPLLDTGGIKELDRPFRLILAGACCAAPNWKIEIADMDKETSAVRKEDLKGLYEELRKKKSGAEDAPDEKTADGAEGSEDAKVTDTEGPDDAKVPEDAKEAEETAAGPVPEKKLPDAPEALLSEAFEIADNFAIPSKISVSGLKRFAAEGDGEGAYDGSIFRLEEKEFPESFGEGAKTRGKKKKLSGAALGTLMHKMMMKAVEDRAYWPETPEKGETEKYTDRLVKKLLKEEVITALEADSVDRGMISGFISSGRGREVRSADKVRCEVPFTFRVDIGRYLPEAALAVSAYDKGKTEDEEAAPGSIKSSLKKEKYVALQGVVDLYYEVEDRVVILDYKTDNTDRKDWREALKAYTLQMRCYRDALEEIAGIEAGECLLYFLKNGEEIAIGRD